MSMYLFLTFQTKGMIGEAKTLYVQAGGKLDDEDDWEDTDDTYDLNFDDDEETQEESLL